jgi:hypothetical protein
MRCAFRNQKHFLNQIEMETSLLDLHTASRSMPELGMGGRLLRFKSQGMK